METKTTTFLTLQIEDKPGNLGKVARCLAERNINVERIQAENGWVHVMTNDPGQAEQCLRDKGYQPKREELLELHVPDRPGQLAAVAEALGKANVNIGSTFGVTPGGEGRLYVRVPEVQKAREALQSLTVSVPSR